MKHRIARAAFSVLAIAAAAELDHMPKAFSILWRAIRYQLRKLKSPA